MKENQIETINDAINEMELEVEALSAARRTAYILLNAMWNDYKAGCEIGTAVEHSQMKNIHDALQLVLDAYLEAENNIRKQVNNALEALGYNIK